MSETGMWIVFWIIVPAALAADLALINPRRGKISVKKALAMTAGWIALALVFGGAVYAALGPAKAVDYITAYVTEYSLSVDNMFVFILIFSYFAISEENRPKVLLWGVLGAVAMRFIFIFAGIKLMEAFSWMMFAFGAVLIFTAVKMLFEKEKKFDPGKNFAFRIIKKIFPFKEDYKGNNFFTVENGRRFATPLLAAVAVVEVTDIIFAADSIPAVLSITRDTFIVYTSNIFAVIGLRSLYFVLSGMANKFPYIKYGIAAILVFVGVKMITAEWYAVSTPVSLAVIAGALALSIAACYAWPPKTAEKK